jgi:hypothetical protein
VPAQGENVRARQQAQDEGVAFRAKIYEALGRYNVEYAARVGANIWEAGRETERVAGL